LNVQSSIWFLSPGSFGASLARHKPPVLKIEVTLKLSIEAELVYNFVDDTQVIANLEASRMSDQTFCPNRWTFSLCGRARRYFKRFGPALTTTPFSRVLYSGCTRRPRGMTVPRPGRSNLR
jgi:hypothetical protein